MKMHTQSGERREILAVARRYRRDGYKVSGPDALSTRPMFLGDLMPDLIAERDDDKVVVEVKRASAVRGSNDIVELAERIAEQPGWRFELIAVPETARIAMPDLGWISEEAGRLLHKGFPKPAFVLIFAAIENLVAYASVRQGRNPASALLPALVRDLVVRGIIDEDTRRRIDAATARRAEIMHSKAEPAPTQGDVEALLKLGRDLQREVLAAAGPPERRPRRTSLRPARSA